MISRDELKRIFKLLRKHEDLFISAYLDNAGTLDDSDIDPLVTETLLNSRLLWQPAADEPIRLARELTGFFDRVLRDPRRLTLDADIGGFLKNIEDSVDRYKDASRAGAIDDIKHYLNQIERLVDELRSSLLDSSGQLWQKINSEFGYVSSLSLKIKENQTVLNQAKRLNDRLELIKVNEMDELAGNDYQLRRYLHRWLLDSVELCRRETVDAIHKLNVLLFEYRKQQQLGRLIDSFYRRYQTNPGYQPLDYVNMGTIPTVFNQVTAMALSGHASIDDPQQEVALTEIIASLRKESVVIEAVEPADSIKVLAHEASIKMVLPALSQAVEEFYLKVLEANKALSAIAFRPGAEIESDVEIWLYAVIAHYNNMDASERILFNLVYEETIDCVFSGCYKVHDVYVALQSSHDLALGASE